MLRAMAIALLLSAAGGQYMPVPFNKGATAPAGFSDSFAYTGNLSANWTGDVSGFAASSGTLTTITNFISNVAWWQAGTFTNAQYSCTKIGTYTGSGHIVGQGVRLSSSTSGYQAFFDGSTWQLWLGNGLNPMNVAGSVTSGHEYCLVIDSGFDLTLEDFTASTTILTYTDSSSTYASGAAGVNAFGNNNTNTITRWRGGSGLP